MANMRKRPQTWNPWKLVTLGMGVALATALVTGVVVAYYVGNQGSQSESQQTGAGGAAPVQQAPAPPAAPAQRGPVKPSAADIEACNRYASSVARDRTTETLTDALIGGAVGAGLGAAGGAIAGGGGGAGKGAGIGGLVGAAAGTLYGLNQANQNDSRAASAYRTCMQRRGFTD